MVTKTFKKDLIKLGMKALFSYSAGNKFTFGKVVDILSNKIEIKWEDDPYCTFSLHFDNSEVLTDIRHIDFVDYKDAP